MRQLQDTNSLKFDSFGLIPCIIQDAKTSKVLMLGYMNVEALEMTRKEGKVTFYSRSKNRLWTKGETSGNFLLVKEILFDCDSDALLIKATPVGPTCHTGDDTCFNEVNDSLTLYFLDQLEQIIKSRKSDTSGKSYTRSLFDAGIAKMAQKVGEEGVETVIEAMADNKERFLEESADLLFHLMVLTQAMDLNFQQIVEVLKKRHSK
jgi:phosphoribosyl-ATP pyrophosphohydrolase/phosphoribosyl-AMP cyclohydrolase